MPTLHKNFWTGSNFLRYRMCTYVDYGLIFTYNKQNCNIYLQKNSIKCHLRDYLKYC